MVRRWQRNAVFPISAAARGALFLVLLTGAGFVGRAMALEDPPPCPKTKAVGRIADVSTSPSTVSCQDTAPCGFTVTVSYINWYCDTASNKKCIHDDDAPQVVVYYFTCKDVAEAGGTMCQNAGRTVLQTMVGLKTEGCP